jgi:CpeT/CpcT family (DUF1001)
MRWHHAVLQVTSVLIVVPCNTLLLLLQTICNTATTSTATAFVITVRPTTHLYRIPYWTTKRTFTATDIHSCTYGRLRNKSLQLYSIRCGTTKTTITAMQVECDGIRSSTTSTRTSQPTSTTTTTRYTPVKHRIRSKSRSRVSAVTNEHSEGITTSTSTVDTRSDGHALLDTVVDWLQGDFDNYRQVVLDRQQNLLPREFGGHEHIHCLLLPVSRTTRLAAFYFDGTPNAIFRFRFYHLRPTLTATPTTTTTATSSTVVNNTTSTTTVDTILYTLSKDLELKLRACSDSMQWSNMFVQHVYEQQLLQMSGTNGMIVTDDDNINNKNYNTTAMMYENIVEVAMQSSCITRLHNCDVRWSWELDPIQHFYVSEYYNQSNPVTSDSADGSGTSIHAIMVHGPTIVESQMIPGQQILIQDQLSLWEDQLWIHDRGYHPTTGEYIYGNQRGVPYRMQRVTQIVSILDYDYDESSDQNVQEIRRLQQHRRYISDPELAWTMGNDYRTQEEYDLNMKRIGGSSRK